MNKGGVLAIIVVMGYIGFELHTVNKARYRMEKPYVFNQFVSANRAFTVCREPKGEAYENFRRNYEMTRMRTIDAIAKANPDASPDNVQQMVAQRIKENEKISDDLIAAKGCADAEVRKHLRRFEIFAGKNLG